MGLSLRHRVTDTDTMHQHKNLPTHRMWQRCKPPTRIRLSIHRYKTCTRIHWYLYSIYKTATARLTNASPDDSKQRTICHVNLSATVSRTHKGNIHPALFNVECANIAAPQDKVVWSWHSPRGTRHTHTSLPDSPGSCIIAAFQNMNFNNLPFPSWLGHCSGIYRGIVLCG